MRVWGSGNTRDSVGRPGRRVPSIIILLILAASLATRPPEAHAQQSQTASAAGLDLCLVPDSIGDQLRRITRRVGGEIGVAAIHLETGARISYNGSRRFPMASVSKIPMAVEFLSRLGNAVEFPFKRGLPDKLQIKLKEYIVERSGREYKYRGDTK